MPRLFYGNFDFEHELADPRGWQASTDVRRMLAERASSWIAIADDGDCIWTPAPIADSFWEALAAAGLPCVNGVVHPAEALRRGAELVPWGWSDQAARMAGQGVARPESSNGMRDLDAIQITSGRATRPSLDAVRIGNSRTWSCELERDLGIGLPGAARVERLDDFAAVVARAASEFGQAAAAFAWVVKANFGMAARERILGRGIELSAAQANWMQRRIAADGAVFFEPWLRLRREVGIQWELPRSEQGQPKLIGLTPLLTDSQGGYQGSVISLDTTIPPEWQQAVAVTERVATQLQQIGYAGPLGIDSVLADDGCGSTIIRPLQDINARYTMGRLALGFRRFLHPGESAVWQHHATNASLVKPAKVIRQMATTPAEIGRQSARHKSELVIL